MTCDSALWIDSPFVIFEVEHFCALNESIVDYGGAFETHLMDSPT